MEIRKNFFRSISRDNWITLLWVLMIGCTSMDYPPKPAPWQCDLKADHAVATGDWSQSLFLHEQLLAVNPTNGLALFHLGYIWGELGDRAREIEYYQRSLDCGYVNDDRLFFNLGMADAAIAEIDAALKAMEKAIDLNPENADNYFGLGLISREAGLTDQAIRALSAAVAHDPRHWEARLLLVSICLDSSRWERAQEQLEYIEQNDPANEALPGLQETLRRRRIGEQPP